MSFSKFQLSLFLFFLLGSFNVFALVDYSEPVAVPEKKAVPKAELSSEAAKGSANSVGSGPSFSLVKAFSDLFGNLKFASTIGLGNRVEELPELAKYNKYTFDMRIESNFHFFFQGKYWIGEGKRFNDNAYNKQSQRGNPELVLGFNFLKIGSAADLATMDLWAGMELPSSSLLAHSRKDQLLFHTEYAYLSLAENKQLNRNFEKVSFTKLTPKLVLNLYPAMDLSLGADFMVKRVDENKKQQLLDAKYFKPQAYGTALFSELTFHF
ncbi:MAG: hypothetical protein L6Q33_13800 [Bacteriovoracaceae bacterium]|nr:hypothetical protein [Bacteriovoracaceae bacterium]